MSSRSALDELAHGLELALAGLRKLMSEADPADWLDQAASPLGRRRHCELARSGGLAGARKVNGRWLVRRREIDAYIESHARVPAQTQSTETEIAEILHFAAARRRRGQ
jgi:hypothetical protein